MPENFEGPKKSKGIETQTEVIIRNLIESLGTLPHQAMEIYAQFVAEPDLDDTPILEQLAERLEEVNEIKGALANALNDPEVTDEELRLMEKGARQTYGAFEEVLKKARDRLENKKGKKGSLKSEE